MQRLRFPAEPTWQALAKVMQMAGAALGRAGFHEPLAGFYPLLGDDGVYYAVNVQAEIAPAPDQQEARTLFAGSERRYRCKICGDTVAPDELRDHLAGHSTAAESAIDGPSQFSEEVAEEPPSER